ncbi:MAG: glycoside hydrolase family 13 protein [Clostridia bacterium]|nr:glycoside hydrolase family 13 protein [Clostridia bacterium]
MSENFFCSTDRCHRDPFGAVAEGTAIAYRVRTPRDWNVSSVLLRVANDAGGENAVSLQWAGVDGEHHEWWECRWTPPSVGLYFYDFVMQAAAGPCTLSRGRGGHAVPHGGWDKHEQWQVTCYAADFVTPDWLAGGVMYQIFPDRYAASGTPKTDVPTDRVLRDRWGEQPVWRPDERGRVLNNDFFGGDLAGITAHLDDLAALGVTCLYLNPIFESQSNHRYDTADYEKIDPLLGDENDLRTLCAEAKKRGIAVLLDGVFSHTGSDSRYFNREGRYEAIGAYQSPDSPYADWYHFRRWPDDYAGWWGFDTLPEVNETHPAYLSYITGENGILRRWLRCGIAGWRLDVADELPDEFLDRLRCAVKAEDADALVLGEVWEDASNKFSYGSRRRYLLGDQLDSVMNYPYRDAVLGFLRGGGSEDFHDRILRVAEHYPPQVLRLLMNHIGTHDTERALTVLVGEPAGDRGREWQAAQTLSPEAREHGLRLMRLAAMLQYCIPGVPCVYYGDEVGMDGYRDPFNRGCYPWGDEDIALREWYAGLGKLRAQTPALVDGSYLPWHMAEELLMFERRAAESHLLCAVNRGAWEHRVPLPENWQRVPLAFGNGFCDGRELVLPPYSGVILVK